MTGIIENFTSKKEDYGEKGNNLKKVLELFKNDEKIIVPETIILTKTLYNKIIKENGKTDFSDYRNIYINPKLEKLILESIHNKFGKNKLVIRSSATCEDSIFFSGAGQYDSFLNIDTEEQIIVAIKKVYASLFSKNSKLYSRIYGINLNKESMAVLIQSVAPVIKSGVMFSCNPVNFEKKYIIESTKGLGTNVVEGIGNICHLEINYNDKDKQDIEVRKLIEVIDKVKAEYNYDVDIEWGIDMNGKIYIFQTRPIIHKEYTFNIKYDEKQIYAKGEPISKGFSIGKIKNITDNKKGCILYQNKKYDFNDLELLLSCKGVILKENAKLSHFANILRELAKPCIYIKEFEFKENHLYVIDAFNGNVIDFETLSAKEKIKFLLDNFNYMKSTLLDSFEKHNGILSISNDDKFEEVVFDINEKRVTMLLRELGFKKKNINQNIYTYDFKDKSLIKENTIFRIQSSEEKINIQFKVLDTEHENYRIEKGIIINFDCLKNAKEFMREYSMQETGYQERRITRYELNGIFVNVIKWPSCKPYLGIEAKSLERLTELNKELNIENCLITGWGGKQIFQKLNLTLEDCKFKK